MDGGGGYRRWRASSRGSFPVRHCQLHEDGHRSRGHEAVRKRVAEFERPGFATSPVELPLRYQWGHRRKPAPYGKRHPRPDMVWSQWREGRSAGCLASDSGALALWGYLLFGGPLLSEKSLLAMTDFGNGFYGLGVYDQTKDGAWRGAGQAIGNGGWHAGGYSSALAVLPSRGLVISGMTNTPGDPQALVFPVAEALASAL